MGLEEQEKGRKLKGRRWATGNVGLLVGV